MDTTPVLVGYFPKRVSGRPDWLKAAGVDEVCSASECVSPGPDGWIDHWRHNTWWLFDTEELAASVVPPAHAGEFRMFAFRAQPGKFELGRWSACDVTSLGMQQLPDGYARLGYDVVSREGEASFSHSPLSCNGAAEEEPVNRHCLFDDLDRAVRFAERVSADTYWEPGPYFVVEVRCRIGT